MGSDGPSLSRRHADSFFPAAKAGCDRFVGMLLGGRFSIERLVARGGMGAIYRAWDERDRRSVALKVIAPDGVERGRLAREAKLLAGLEHEAIVQYVASGRSRQGEPFIAMSWLEGSSLAERFTRGPLAILETIAFGRRLASALDYLRSAGIIHRDLKPANVILVHEEFDRAQLIDFGVARHHDDLEDRYDDRQCSPGTLGYMAPEQILRPVESDARADLFSLGCVLYEALTGQSPFAANSAPAVLARVLLDEPAPLWERRQDIPAALAELVELLLQKEPSRRTVDARGVRETLGRIMAELPEAREPSEPAEISGVVRAELHPGLATARASIQGDPLLDVLAGVNEGS